MIRTFVPSKGRKATQTYKFPTYATDQRGTTARNTLQAIAGGDGSFVASGSGPLPIDNGTFTVTFDLYASWLTNFPTPSANYYNGTLDDGVAIMNAIIDFMISVREGGSGLLTDQLSSGVKDWATGDAITSFTCEAYLADYTDAKQASKAQIECTFYVPSGYWTIQPSGIPLVFC